MELHHNKASLKRSSLSAELDQANSRYSTIYLLDPLMYNK
jgi:hypothetical protein